MIKCRSLTLCKLAKNQIIVLGGLVFINEAWAQTASSTAKTGGLDLVSFLPIAGMIVLMYFLLIRPQQKKAKDLREMLAALQKGDEIVTAGGVLGSVTKLDENYATVEIAKSVEIRVQRSAIQSVLPKGTIKTAD